MLLFLYFSVGFVFLFFSLCACVCLCLFVFSGFFFVVFVSVFFSFCALVLAFCGFGRFRVFLYVFAPISTAGYRTAGALQYLVVTPFVIIGCGLWTSGWHLMRSSQGTNKLGSCLPSLALILIKLYVLPRAYSKDLLKNMRLLQVSWASGNVTSWYGHETVSSLVPTSHFTPPLPPKTPKDFLPGGSLMPS